MMDRPRSDPGASSALGKLAGFVIAVVVLAGIYVGYQALQVLFPPNTYETALLATVADTVDADGVLLFDEVYVPGGGTLGYLAAERVSAGAAVAENYSSPEQAGLRQQLTSLDDQIELLQRSQNTTATQLDSLKKERASALYDMMDALDSSAYDETAQGEENYILAQNKLWVITGEVSDFSAQIASLTEQSAQVQAQLGEPTQITAPQTGYFIRSSASGRLNAGADDILALNTTDLQGKTDAEIMAAYRNGGELTVEEYLFAAQELTDCPKEQVAILTAASKKYNDARVYNNLGVAQTKVGDKAAALKSFEKAAKMDSSKELNKNLLLANLANNNTAEAKKYAAAADAQAKAAMAAAEGDYKTAARNLEGYNAAIALVQSNDLAGAKKAIAKDNSADADYLRAVIAVKEGDMKSAEAQLKSATSKNPELAKKAAKDVNLKALKK